MTPRGAGFGLDSPLLLLRGYLAFHPLPRSLPDGSDSSLVGVRTQNVSEARTPFPRLSARLSEEGGCFLTWHPQEAGAGVGRVLWRRPRESGRGSLRSASPGVCVACWRSHWAAQFSWSASPAFTVYPQGPTAEEGLPGAGFETRKEASPKR